MSQKTDSKKYLILENIRSVYNVGAIFRTADAIGIDKIFLVGYTPAPIDRFGRVRADVHKAALGAEESVVWEQVADASVLIENLKAESYQIVALEQGKKSSDYKKIKLSDKTAIVVGNEVDGVSKEVLKLSDILAEIPMIGKKESLNVSVAAGIFLFRLFDQ